MIKKDAPTGVAEGGVNHNEGLCTAFRALADLLRAKGDDLPGNTRCNALSDMEAKLQCCAKHLVFVDMTQVATAFLQLMQVTRWQAFWQHTLRQ